MTRKQFSEIMKQKGWDEAMSQLSEIFDDLTDYETLKSYVIKKIEADENMLALHIWNAVYNSEGDSEWYKYDYTAGTTDAPKCLNTIDDLVKYGFLE